MGVQGQDFKADLLGPNSKPSKGLRKANLTPRTKALLEEVALSEQVCSPPLSNLDIRNIELFRLDTRCAIWPVIGLTMPFIPLSARGVQALAQTATTHLSEGMEC